MHKIVYLSLGSNVGDRAANLRTALLRLEAFGKVAAVSSFYETEPLELVAQPWFLNCAVKLETEKMPRQLLAAVLDLEREMGRRRTQKKGPRNIDIDILLFGNSVVKSQGADDSASGVAGTAVRSGALGGNRGGDATSPPQTDDARTARCASAGTGGPQSRRTDPELNCAASWNPRQSGGRGWNG